MTELLQGYCFGKSSKQTCLTSSRALDKLLCHRHCHPSLPPYLYLCVPSSLLILPLALLLLACLIDASLTPPSDHPLRFSESSSFPLRLLSESLTSFCLLVSCPRLDHDLFIPVVLASHPTCSFLPPRHPAIFQISRFRTHINF